MKFYSLLKLLSYNADVNIIVGQRGNGKSYGVLDYALQQYKKHKKRFCYIRRWADDLKGFRAEQLLTPFTDRFDEIFGKGMSVVYYRHKFYLVDDSGTKKDIIGYTLALSEASHTKSVSYADVGTIIVDEIIQMAGESILRDEKLKYENTISTIVRHRSDEVKIFLIGNTVSKFSWIFVYYGIPIDKVKQGQIWSKDYPTDDKKQVLRVAFEYCEYNEDIGKKSSKFSHSNMINKGQWEIPEVDDIPTVKGEICKDRLLFTIYEPEAEVIVGCFLRHSKWSTLEKNEDTLLYEQTIHHREFLILRTINYKSNYYHLSNQKSLNYHTYNDLDIMLNDIKENTDIDFEHELYMGRIFADNMFTADYFNHSWGFYGRVTPRALL